MAPDSSKRWMQTHRHLFGDLPITELCLPASHDAGTYRSGYHTLFGTESNVITQTRSIFDQLELGVRHLDIRPCLTSPEPNANPGNWACGHYTGEGSDKIGWQGANGMEIREVVDELNRFTKDNTELIVVEITHTYRVFINGAINSTARGPNSDEWKSLLDLLSGIKNLFTVDRAGGAAQLQHQLHHRTLNDYIGKGQAAVIVLVDDYVGPQEHLLDRGLWPIKMQDGGHRLPLRGASVTRMQSTFEAITSTIDLLQIFGPDSNSTSVLSLARKVQEEKFPWLLQELAAESGYPSVIGMDRIQNADLLTFCLAVAYQRFNRTKGLKNMVIVYGGSILTSSAVHNKVRDAIDTAKSLRVTNDNLGGDPFPDVRKSCAVFYEQDGIVKGRFAEEGYSLHFEQDVLSIEYGNRQIRDQGVYLRVLKAIKNRELFTVTNENLGGDPLPNVRKKCIIRFRDMNDDDVREESALEAKVIDFETWMEKLGKAVAGSHKYMM